VQRQGSAQANPILVQRPPAAAPAEEESPDMQRKRAQLKDLRVNMQRCAKRLGLTEHALIRQVKYRWTPPPSPPPGAPSLPPSTHSSARSGTGPPLPHSHPPIHPQAVMLSTAYESDLFAFE